MVKKAKVSYVCSACGAMYSSWAGKCTNCGEWNTILEKLAVTTATAKQSGTKLQLRSIDEVAKSKPLERIKANIGDMDDVLGGGIVPGSVILLAGQPGIGKSTLLMQVAANIAKNHKVMYISGEESAEQVAMRASRLGSGGASLMLATSTSANDVASTVASESVDLVVVDSIQTLACSEISSAAGSVSQITNSTQLITQAAKATNTALLIVGHVTKEGSIAGPKVLEHLVDVVLQLEGDRYGGFKVLRAVKNRFGSTNEASIFDMQEGGLKPVENPSAALLAERQVSDGSVVLATLEGNRPLLVEVQALVNTSSYGYPKRTASGFDINRLNLLVAVLEKRTKLNLSDKDIFINIVGGLKINDPAADLAVCMAIGSAAKGLKLSKDAVVYGEVGLSGEIRHVPQAEKRVAEGKKLGFELAVGPKYKSNKLTFLHPVSDVREALNTFLQ
ncbi:DNA repair protein RadA [Candidatus Saccharibacteria bacterium]|nr:DNA repair protein RadA [Candidatus Saccharibacteria bacterium]